MSPDLDKLSRALGYTFSRPSLLENALTHRSYGRNNNERLEFLGDAILGFVVAAELYRRFPEMDEGTLSRRRAALVKKESLAELARGLGLGDYLRLGSGELKSGGHRRESILADALEAVLGAVYLDAGMGDVYPLIVALYGDRLDIRTTEQELKDPKTRLQEHLQARGLALPAYDVVEVGGEAHDQTFVVECRIEEPALLVTGRGSSRRKAEQEAARGALGELNG